MTLMVLSEIIGNKGFPHREMMAQGVGNIFCGVLRGMGGDAMIGQSVINVKSGGHRRLSGVLASVFISIFIVVASDFINIIPLAGLAGVMYVVVILTFEWNTFRLFTQIPIVDSITIVVVTVLTVVTSDLSIGVGAGLGIACLYYAYVVGLACAHVTPFPAVLALKTTRTHLLIRFHRHSCSEPATIRYTSGRRLEARIEEFEDEDENGEKYTVKIYHIEGNIFFGSLPKLQRMMSPRDDPKVVILHLENAKLFDLSAAQVCIPPGPYFPWDSGVRCGWGCLSGRG